MLMTGRARVQGRRNLLLFVLCSWLQNLVSVKFAADRPEILHEILERTGSLICGFRLPSLMGPGHQMAMEAIGLTGGRYRCPCLGFHDEINSDIVSYLDY
jgi:hypothetical protein